MKRLFLFACLLAMGTPQAWAKKAPDTLSFQFQRQDVRLQTYLSPGTYRRLTKKGWQYRIRVWRHTGKRWERFRGAVVNRSRQSLSLSKASLCRNVQGKVLIQVAIGRVKNKRWWSLRKRTSLKAFVPLRHRAVGMYCGMKMVRKQRRAKARRAVRVKRAAPKGAKSIGHFGGAKTRSAGAARMRPGASVRGRRYGNAWRGSALNSAMRRYGNAWRGTSVKGRRYGNAWRGTGAKKKAGVRGRRYGNAWRGTDATKPR